MRSRSTPRTGISWTLSSSRARTSARTNTAVRWRTACGSSMRSSTAFPQSSPRIGSACGSLRMGVTTGWAPRTTSRPSPTRSRTSLPGDWPTCTSWTGLGLASTRSAGHSQSKMRARSTLMASSCAMWATPASQATLSWQRGRRMQLLTAAPSLVIRTSCTASPTTFLWLRATQRPGSRMTTTGMRTTRHMRRSSRPRRRKSTPTGPLPKRSRPSARMGRPHFQK
mmetsp:Transcript_14343/g.42338  ORF Transcript_14343/g.42338 Transcript_14343/m.42338 type:complete len:225 (-) Transcript_14343:409-1083(-)